MFIFSCLPRDSGRLTCIAHASCQPPLNYMWHQPEELLHAVFAEEGRCHIWKTLIQEPMVPFIVVLMRTKQFYTLKFLRFQTEVGSHVASTIEGQDITVLSFVLLTYTCLCRSVFLKCWHSKILLKCYIYIFLLKWWSDLTELCCRSLILPSHVSNSDSIP